jgi:hypothetical protein
MELVSNISLTGGQHVALLDHTTLDREAWTLDGYKAGEWFTLWMSTCRIDKPDMQQVGNLSDSGYISLVLTHHTPPTEDYPAWYNMLIWRWDAGNRTYEGHEQLPWSADAKCV